MNLYQSFAQQAQQHAERIAVVDGDKRLSYGELLRKVEGMAAVLAAGTEAPGVAIYLPTSAAFVIAAYGAWRAGLYVVPLNLLVPPATLSLILKDSGVDTVITCEPLAPALAGMDVRTILVEDLARAAAAGQLPPMEALAGRAPAAGGELAILLYTSGTTGMPKGVRLTHDNIFINIQDCLTTFQIQPGEVILGILPLFHTFALTGTMGIPLHSGGTFVTHARFNPEAALASIAAEGVTLLIAVPTMFRVLTQMQRLRPVDVSSLRFGVTGGEPLPPRIQREFEEVFGVELLQGYGLTETSPVISVNPPGANRSGTAGPPLPNVKVNIRGEDGVELPRGEVGELAAWGPTVMEGYHNRPEETASVLKDGWLLTGDMAKMDDEGYITITGRKKEMIIVGGLNVFPAEIEALLDEHPGVAHCAVMGVSDERHGEQIRAYVVPKQLPEGAQGDGNLPADAVPGLEQQIREHLKERLPGYKMPRQYVFRAQLPLGPTGKVLKRALVE